MITRCRSSISMAAKSCGPRLNTAPLDCASCWACWRARACAEVAIERPDGPVVDTLLDAGVTVVVISPNQVKNLRARYGSAGNKDDRFDAFVLADTLRTDRAGCTRCCPTPRPRSPCAKPAAPAKTSSPTGLRWPTSCART